MWPFVNRRSLAVVILFFLGCILIWRSGSTLATYHLDHLLASYLLGWGLYALLSNLQRHEIQARFLLMTMAILVFVGVFETPAIFRLLDYREILRTPAYPVWWNQPGYIEDDELIWTHEPYYHRKGTYNRGDIEEALCATTNQRLEYEIRYDHNGFRNDTHLTSADIAIVGDSFVDAPMIAKGSLMTTTLGELEAKEVANLGTMGYGPQQELIVLKRFGLPLHPKTIVWVFYEGNDLHDAQFYDQNFAKTSDHGMSWKGQLSIFWDRSLTRNLLLKFASVRNGCQPVAGLSDAFAVVNDGAGKGRYLHFLSEVRDVPGDAHKESEALSIVRSTLTDAYQVSRKHGIRFVVVFAPTAFRVYNGLPNVVHTSQKVQHWVASDLPDRLRSIVIGISPQIDYLDLTPILKRETQNGSLVFLPGDTHWTDEGHRIVAHALHQTLLSDSQ